MELERNSISDYLNICFYTCNSDFTYFNNNFNNNFNNDLIFKFILSIIYFTTSGTQNFHSCMSSIYRAEGSQR